ncbi:GTA-gp10 family protein [Roseovarius sp. B08]|uniref:GTA-gp10 family protein n=1 Tax=Roseovarius sp. B08 TaxID=3449223 RepID=UPI003EDC91D0
MANAVKGKVDFTSGDEGYSLQFTTNGMCALEEESGETMMAFIQRLEQNAETDMSMKDVRILFWAGLQEHHEGITLKEAGRVMTGVEGGFMGAVALYERALQLAFPDAVEGQGDAPGKAKGKGPQ